MIAGSTPACALHESLGFRRFGGSVVFNYTRSAPPETLPLPEGYTTLQIDASDWRAEYELARCSTPASVQQYEMVEEARFRTTCLDHLVGVILRKASGTRREKVAVSVVSDR